MRARLAPEGHPVCGECRMSPGFATRRCIRHRPQEAPPEPDAVRYDALLQTGGPSGAAVAAKFMVYSMVIGWRSVSGGHSPTGFVGISNTNPVPFASWWQLMQLVANAAVVP